MEYRNPGKEIKRQFQDIFLTSLIVCGPSAAKATTGVAEAVMAARACCRHCCLGRGGPWSLEAVDSHVLAPDTIVSRAVTLSRFVEMLHAGSSKRKWVLRALFISGF